MLYCIVHTVSGRLSYLSVRYHLIGRITYMVLYVCLPNGLPMSRISPSEKLGFMSCVVHACCPVFVHSGVVWEDLKVRIFNPQQYAPLSVGLTKKLSKTLKKVLKKQFKVIDGFEFFEVHRGEWVRSVSLPVGPY